MLSPSSTSNSPASESSEIASSSSKSASAPSSSSAPTNWSQSHKNFYTVFEIISHIHGLVDVVLACDPLDIGNEMERKSFIAMKLAIIAFKSSQLSTMSCIETFMKSLVLIANKQSPPTKVTLENLAPDIVQAWVKFVQLFTLVMPPFQDVFLGRISRKLSDVNPAWMDVPTCVNAVFDEKVTNLDKLFRSYLGNQESLESNSGNIQDPSSDIIQRLPEILVISCESSLLPKNLLSTDKKIKTETIEFPKSFDISLFQTQKSLAHEKDIEKKVSGGMINIDYVNGIVQDFQRRNGDSAANLESILHEKIYDLASVVTFSSSSSSSGHSYTSYLRHVSNDVKSSSSSYSDKWTKSNGFQSPKIDIDSIEAVEKNFYPSSSNSSIPRLLVYVKRSAADLLLRLKPFVTKAGQCRAMGDITITLATTVGDYKEARRFYDEAISFDPTYKEILRDILQSLDKVDSIQNSHGLEMQGDISLANHRLKESTEYYLQGSVALHSIDTTSSSSSENPPSSSSNLIQLTHLATLTNDCVERLKEKQSYVKQIQSLEIVVHFVEKGEEALRDGKYSNAKDYYQKVVKLCSNLHLKNHFSIISTYVEKTMQTVNAIQKIDDAHVAMKEGKYRLANSLFGEAIVLVPDKASGLQNILDGFTPLIQCEDALIQQRAGLAAMEEKNYQLASELFTCAIELLPIERLTDLAIFYSDRGLAYYELHDYDKALSDCNQALSMRSDYAIAYFRKGAILFAQNKFNEAIEAYDKAEGYDSSLSSLIKVKVRQINTTKEVALRKERELERARQKEEEKKVLDQLKKERLERQKEEQNEKQEKQKMKEEDKLSKQLRDVSTNTISLDSQETTEDSIQEKLKKSKLRDEEKQRAKESKQLHREKIRLEKEKEKERIKQEKLALELKQQQEKAAEAARIQMEKDYLETLRLKKLEAEKEKEAKRLQAERDRQEKEALLQQQQAEKLKLKRLEEEKRLELEREQKAKELEAVPLKESKDLFSTLGLSLPEQSTSSVSSIASVVGSATNSDFLGFDIPSLPSFFNESDGIILPPSESTQDILGVSGLLSNSSLAVPTSSNESLSGKSLFGNSRLGSIFSSPLPISISDDGLDDLNSLISNLVTPSTPESNSFNLTSSSFNEGNLAPIASPLGSTLLSSDLNASAPQWDNNHRIYDIINPSSMSYDLASLSLSMFSNGTNSLGTTGDSVGISNSMQNNLSNVNSFGFDSFQSQRLAPPSIFDENSTLQAIPLSAELGLDMRMINEMSIASISPAHANIVLKLREQRIFLFAWGPPDTSDSLNSRFALLLNEFLVPAILNMKTTSLTGQSMISIGSLNLYIQEISRLGLNSMLFLVIPRFQFINSLDVIANFLFHTMQRVKQGYPILSNPVAFSNDEFPPLGSMGVSNISVKPVSRLNTQTPSIYPNNSIGESSNLNGNTMQSLEGMNFDWNPSPLCLHVIGDVSNGNFHHDYFH